MKRQMQLVISDAPVQDVKMALAKEHHERTGVVGLLMNQGHVTILKDEDPAFIRLQIEDEIFKEERARFPTTTLIARLQLAIHAGKSERNVERVEVASRNMAKHAALGMSYHMGDQMHGVPKGYKSWEEVAPWADALETGYNNVARITATVKKFRKGLRP